MTLKSPLLRVFIEPTPPVASLCLVVQLTDEPAIIWEWELPYALWQYGGTAATAAWLGEQFRRHDAATARAVGHPVVVQALRHGLQRHLRFEWVDWLQNCPA